LVYPHRDDLHKIVVLNPKGGSGKTTLAVNIASYFALRGPMPTLIDYDPQGFATEWLARRATNRPIIAILRDSKNFVDAANKGIGIHEMPAYQVRNDIDQLDRVMRWIEQSRQCNRPASDAIPVPTGLPLPGRPLH